MRLLLQARIRGCERQSRRSALRHTVGDRHPSSWWLSPSEERDSHCRRRRSLSPALRVPVSLHVCTLSRRTFMNNAGYQSLMGRNYKASRLRKTTMQSHELTRIILERFCCNRRCLTHARRAGRGRVNLVHLVYLVCLVQPNKRDRPDKRERPAAPRACPAHFAISWRTVKK